jgi:hypothetical protein
MHLWQAYILHKDTLDAMFIWGECIATEMMLEILLFPLLEMLCFMLCFMLCVNKRMLSHCTPFSFCIDKLILYSF